jgi:uncharacterized protein
MYTDFQAPLQLTNGLTMTMHAALRAGKTWEKYTVQPEPIDQEHIFSGANGVPIYGRVSIPENPRGTIVATYGITGTLDNQWFLQALRRKAYAQGWAVVLFDWRAHGQTALLSPQLTSDGIYEGEDFLQIAAQAKALGCPVPIWLSGYSLGGQLALWGIKQAPVLSAAVGLGSQDIAGGFVICPSLESDRSLTYLVNHPIKSILENRIAKELKKLAWQLQAAHPQHFDPAAIERANSIEGFDRELVIPRLGFATVKDYYLATSPLYFLDKLTLPTLIIYAADDPLFDPSLVPELASIAQQQPAIDLMLTKQGGHVGYISSSACQQQYLDTDPWWAWNRALEWVQQ